MKKRWLTNVIVVASSILIGCAGNSGNTGTTATDAAQGTTKAGETASEETKAETTTKEVKTKYEGKEYSKVNDRVELKVDFLLPDSEYGWIEKGDDTGVYIDAMRSAGMSFWFYPDDSTKEINPEKNCEVRVSLGIWDDWNKERFESEEGFSKESVNVHFIDPDTGIRWKAETNPKDAQIEYSALLDEYYDGYRGLTVSVKPFKKPDDLSKVDMEYMEQFALTVVNTLTYETDYEGKPDLSDAVYSANLFKKWPAEIPFEGGVIKAERTLKGEGFDAYFTYEDPVREGMVYTVFLADSVRNNPSKDQIDDLDKKYFGENPIFKEHTFVDTEISGYRAASNTKYGAGDHGTGHDVYVTLGFGEDGANWILKFKAYSKLDKEKANAAKEKGLTDFSWLTDEFSTGADEYSMAKADEVLAAVLAAMEDGIPIVR